MRVLSLAVALALWSTASHAQQSDTDLDQCAQTEAWFNMAVEARQNGDNKRKVRRVMSKEMGRDAAEQLVDFIFLLPEAQLSPEVGKAARLQCEAL